MTIKIVNTSKIERENLYLLFTDEKIHELSRIYEHISNSTITSGPFIRRFRVLGNRTCDCLYTFEADIIKDGIQKNIKHVAFVRMKPTAQSFLDAAKQLNQERAAYDKDSDYNYTDLSKFIVTFDSDERFDDMLAKQNFAIIRYPREENK